MPELIVKTMTNRKIPFSYEEDYTVKMLKQIVAHKEGLQTDLFKLIHNGMQMEQNKKLTDYNVGPGSILIMILSLIGGQLI